MKAGIRDYSSEIDVSPLQALAAMFDAHGWPCEIHSDEELIGEIQGSWAKYQIRCVWRTEDHVLQLLCLPEIRVSPEKHMAAIELLSLINEQLWLGHFEIWSSGSVLLYRNGQMLGEDGLLSLTQARTMVETALDECDRFYPAFQFVLWGDKTPADALQSALIDAAGEA
ncbi:MAG: YbjN domain-containing protein [Sphingomonadaceae bacterium]